MKIQKLFGFKLLAQKEKFEEISSDSIVNSKVGEPAKEVDSSLTSKVGEPLEEPVRKIDSSLTSKVGEPK